MAVVVIDILSQARRSASHRHCLNGSSPPRREPATVVRPGITHLINFADPGGTTLRSRRGSAPGSIKSTVTPNPQST